MSIDIGRLATDRAYWDSVAPEGATHYQPQQQMFYKRNGKDNWRVYSNRWWKSPATSDSALWVKRPEQWIDGLPPVGVECEFRCVFLPWEGRTCKPIHFEPKTDLAWLHLDGNELSNLYVLAHFEFRPLRTPEQRERQSVIEQAFSKLSEFHDADQVLGDLYDAGMLHKQED